jgi:ketosteroid isomerase-like protein
MKYHAARLPVALLTFFLGVTAAGAWAGMDAEGRDERAVLAVEREYVRAHIERDVAALERVLADDFTSFGGRVNKGHRLALLSNPFFKITALKTDGVEVAVRGHEATVSGRAKMTSSFRGREFTTPWYEYTRHYERRGGRWLIVSCEFSVSW